MTYQPDFTELLKYPTTFASRPGDFSFWHKNRKHYAVWAIELKNHVLCQLAGDARVYMSEFLLPDYPRQLHVTLGQCGFLSNKKNYADDYTEKDFQEDIRKLSELDRSTLTVKIGGVLCCFAIAPFFPILDEDGSLLELHKLMARSIDSEYVFTPHITLGLFCDDWPSSKVHEHVISYPGTADCKIDIDEIKLFSYQADEVCGALTELACFSLREKRISYMSDILFSGS